MENVICAIRLKLHSAHLGLRICKIKNKIKKTEHQRSDALQTRRQIISVRVNHHIRM